MATQHSAKTAALIAAGAVLLFEALVFLVGVFGTGGPRAPGQYSVFDGLTWWERLKGALCVAGVLFLIAFPIAWLMTGRAVWTSDSRRKDG